MATFAEDIAAVLPATDTVSGDKLQLITRAEYFTIMGPLHEDRFMRMASFHPGGNTSRPVVYDLLHFVELFWPEGDPETTGVIRWSVQPHFVDQFRNVTVYRRVAPNTVRTVMHVGETSDSPAMRIVLYEAGIRKILQEVRPERVGILHVLGAKKVSETPNAHGRYEMETDVTERPARGKRPFPPGMHRGRR
jgi:hypothetical protein